MFFRTLQTVGPSHARTYTVAVYFKGERIGCGKGPRSAQPAWETDAASEPWPHKVLKTGDFLPCDWHTWPSPPPLPPASPAVPPSPSLMCRRKTAALHRRRLLQQLSSCWPDSIGGRIMHNENESIHYWFDVNCVMEKRERRADGESRRRGYFATSEQARARSCCKFWKLGFRDRREVWGPICFSLIGWHKLAEVSNLGLGFKFRF